jgi:hypothetical protein
VAAYRPVCRSEELGACTLTRHAYLAAMRSNQRLFHRGLRVLVLAVVLVLVPAKTTAFDSTVESTPMLVLSASHAEPADVQHRDAARELGAAMGPSVPPPPPPPPQTIEAKAEDDASDDER